MTVEITKEMLSGWTEYKLLRFMLMLYVAREESDKPIEGLASVAQVERGRMIEALNGETDLGGDSWRRIEKHFKTKIYHEWLDAKAGL